MENEFYEFALEQFQFIRAHAVREKDGDLYILAQNFFYEKIYPKSNWVQGVTVRFLNYNFDLVFTLVLSSTTWIVDGYIRHFALGYRQWRQGSRFWLTRQWSRKFKFQPIFFWLNFGGSYNLLPGQNLHIT